MIRIGIQNTTSKLYWSWGSLDSSYSSVSRQASNFKALNNLHKKWKTHKNFMMHGEENAREGELAHTSWVSCVYVCVCVCVCVCACVRACEWRRGQISALFQNFHAEWQLIMTPAQIKKMYTTFHPSTQFYLNPLFTQNWKHRRQSIFHRTAKVSNHLANVYYYFQCRNTFLCSLKGMT